MEKSFSQKGPWEWLVRDCAWYPDFLQCRPQAGARLCIYAMKPPEGPAYECVIECSDIDLRPSIDSILKDLLLELPSQNLRESDLREWPFD